MAPIPKVLVVDDDVLLVSLIESTLKKKGYHIIKAYNGEEALQKVNEDSPDLIILDVMMPGMDGLEVCRRLRSKEETRLIPIVMLTAKDYVEDKISGLETGADDYVIKPFNVKEFLARIHGLIEKRTYQYKRAEEEKLEALEKLAESVAHEVRNPIVAIGGFARRIRDRLPEGDTLSMYADHILSEVQRLETMVNEIVKLNAIIIAKPEPLDMRVILDTALEKYAAPVREKQIHITKQYSPAIPLIRGDGKSLDIAFSHVIENALDAMDTGGSLTLSIEPEDQQVLMRITDSGKGIAISELSQVVRPFYTSKMSGAGMGLTIVKHIVTLHEGEITITSKKGEGTTVTIIVPAHAASQLLKEGPGEC